MTRRTRSFLVDNTLGKVFTGVTTIVEGSPDKLIAGTKLLTRTLASSAFVEIVPVKNLGPNAKGMYLSANGALVTRIDLSVATTASIQPIIIVARKGTSYATSTIVGTYSLSPRINTTGYITEIQLNSTESLFFDVTQVGSLIRGKGLTIRVSYYSG